MAYYNRSEYVLECVNSLLEQNYDAFEVIVVNDGSSDTLTKEKLNSIQNSRLRVVHQSNTGFVGAIRNAISLSQGEYIAIQGAGDVSLPTRIEKQANVLDKNPEIGMVSCLFENVDFGGEKNGFRTKRSYSRTNIDATDFLSGANPFGHGEVMFRKSIYEKVGGYRTFFKFSQDLDLWLRMIEHCKAIIIPEYLYERRKFIKDGVSTDEKKLFLQKYLAEFARQCYVDRKIEGSDFIDLYGMHAGLFKSPNKEISKLISKRIFKALKDENPSLVKFYTRFSKSEPKTIGLTIALALAEVNKFKLGQKLIAKSIQLYLKIR